MALSNIDRLTLEDILQLPLNSYKIISLSACETAVTGNQTITTEYVGLASAFLRQGAANVLSTLWTVESISSAVFMIEFYRCLHRGVTPGAALKQTQQWLRNLTYRDLSKWYTQRAREIEKYDSTTAEDLQDEADNIISNKTNLDARPFTNYYYWASFIITGNINS